MRANFDLDPAQWTTLRRLLDTALALAPAERDTWLGQLGAEHEDLKPRLQRLLAHADGGSPLDTLPKVETAQFLAERSGDEAALAAGASVGPYRLLRSIGSGGMGEVWLAERADMLHKRQVALKLPRLLTGRAALAERLAREREILAALNHPNIARLYDAGLAADGQPYLALEYVEGERIDAYCQRQALEVPARLRLFLQVARAIAHAHAQLVVHRDLKPANILVTDAGEVRLLDFGIAKLLDEGQAHETELTQLAGRALTPEYAAPEQILGQPIATSADVYALGVVLFELLTGSRPYKLKRDSRAALEEAIVAAEAPRPSSVVEDPKLKKRLRGDLDTICLKALKKPPAERYRSVEALAEDIERHLEQRPVLAQPDSRIYRIRKFLARNTLAVGATAAVMLAIVAGAGVAGWQAQLATAEGRRSNEVKQFVISMFEAVDPDTVGSARSVSARQILESAEQRVQRELSTQTAVRAELYAAIARSHGGLLDFRRSKDVASKALAELAEELTPRDPAIIELKLVLAKAHKEMGELELAEGVLRELDRQSSREHATSEAALKARLLSADVANSRGRWQESVEIANGVLNGASRAAGGKSEIVAEASELLSRGYVMLRDKAHALKHSERAHEERLKLHHGDIQHPRVFRAAQAHAALLIDLGLFNRAKPLLEQCLESARAVYGPDSPLLVEYASRLGLVELDQGRIAKALELLEESDRIAEKNSVPETIMRAGQLRAFARAYIRRRDFASAAAKLQRSLQIMEKYKNPEISRVVEADLAFAMTFTASAPEAAASLQRIAGAQDSGESRYKTHLPSHYLGVVHRLLGKPREAMSWLQRAQPLARANTRRSELAEALIDQALVHLDLADAAAGQALLEEASGLLNETQFEMSPPLADLALGLGRVRLLQQQYDEAEEHLVQADRFWRELDPDSRWAGEAAFYLAQCLDALGRTAEAKLRYARAAQILAKSPFPADTALVSFAPG